MRKLITFIGFLSCGISLVASDPDVQKILEGGVDPSSLTAKKKAILSLSHIVQGYLGIMSAEHDLAMARKDKVAPTRDGDEVTSKILGIDNSYLSDRDEKLSKKHLLLTGRLPKNSVLYNFSDLLRSGLWGMTDGACRVDAVCDQLSKSPIYQSLRRDNPNVVPSITAIKYSLISLLSCITNFVGKIPEDASSMVKSQVANFLYQPIFSGTVEGSIERSVLQRFIPTLLYMNFSGGAEGVTGFDRSQRSWRRAATNSIVDICFSSSSKIASSYVDHFKPDGVKELREYTLGLADPELPAFLLELLVAMGSGALARNDCKNSELFRNYLKLSGRDLEKLSKGWVSGSDKMMKEDGIVSAASDVALNYLLEKVGGFFVEKILRAMSSPVVGFLDKVFARFGRGLSQSGLVSEEVADSVEGVGAPIRDAAQGFVGGQETKSPNQSGSKVNFFVSRIFGDPMLMATGLERDTFLRVASSALTLSILQWCGVSMSRIGVDAFISRFARLFGGLVLWYLVAPRRGDELLKKSVYAKGNWGHRYKVQETI